MANAQVSATDVLFYRNAPTERSFRNRIIGLLALPGVGIDIVSLPLALSTAALAGARFDDLRLLPLLVVVFLATGVANMVNDIVDAERDKAKWPLRPLATGLLSRSEAILYTAILSAIGIVIAIVVFNWLFLALGLLVLCGEPRLFTLYARQHRLSYCNVASGVSSCSNMECFLARDRINPTPVAPGHFLGGIFAGAIDDAGSTRPTGSHPLHPAPPHCREGALYSVCYRLVCLWRSDLIVCTVVLALHGGTGRAYGVALNSGKKFGRQ